MELPMRAVLLLCLLVPAAQAATLAERSPVQPGAWWTPQRAGSGFELHAIGDQFTAGWFTFEADGSPVWYTAQGSWTAAGTAVMPLRRHAWRDGAYAGSVQVGDLQLAFRGAQAIDATWTLGADRGTWALQPFPIGGAPTEVDRLGLWFDPARSGWGLSVAEGGSTFAATLYAYDAQGRPRWWTGAGTAGALQLNSFRGACPACPMQPSTVVGALSLGVAGDDDRALAVQRFTTGEPLAAGLGIDGAALRQITLPASRRLADRTLAAFGDEASLRRFLLSALETRPISWASVDFSPPPHVAFSNTNVQEFGVDEAGRVKSDGNYIYTFAHDEESRATLPDLRILPVAAQGEAVGTPTRIPLASREGGRWTVEAGLYLDDTRLVAVTGSQASSTAGVPWSDTAAWRSGNTWVEVFDRSAPLAPRSLWRARFDGHLVASRRVGDRLVVVLRHAVELGGIITAPSTDAQRAANRRLFDATVTDALLPQFAVGNGPRLPLVAPGDILLPPLGSQEPQPQFVFAVAIDLARPGVESVVAIAGAIDAVYAAPRNLYLVSSRYATARIGLPGFTEPPLPLTDVHRIALDGPTLALTGSGTVEGFLGRTPDTAPLRLSEADGRLRVATSSQRLWGGAVVNRLSVLEPSTRVPGMLRTLAVLPNARRPEPLGKPGELLYGTRFVGDRLYAVTFERIDPLYVVDLSVPADPRIAGAVDLPGFSDWLHPLPGGLLLGVGRDARTSGGVTWFQGLQLNLFDVRDAARPAVLQTVLVGKRGSESALLAHPHAYSEIQPAGAALSFALPARVHDGAPTSGSGDWASYAWSSSGLLRYEVAGSGANARLRALEPLVVDRAPGTDPLLAQRPWMDPAADGARSVLFPRGTVYVGDGRFWHQAVDGGVRGPF